uniref:Uncharacterized protein n=1 Tax=Rhizophora mucronata TaxID=61149 RepID=A0A2P2Q5D0_RHIMU
MKLSSTPVNLGDHHLRQKNHEGEEACVSLSLSGVLLAPGTTPAHHLSLSSPYLSL